MEIPRPLLVFYHHLSHHFPECQIQYISKDFDRQKSFSLLNPSNGRTFSITVDNDDVAHGRQELLDHQIKDIRSFLFEEATG